MEKQLQRKKKKIALHWKIIIGMVLGVVWAYLSIANGWRTFTDNWISPFGEMFIRGLKFIATPLVLFSIIVGVSGLKDIRKLGRIGLKTLSVYLLTTAIAVVVGLVLVNVLRPGNAIAEEQRIKNRILYEMWVASQPDVAYKDEKRYAADPHYAHLLDRLQQSSAAVGAGLDAIEQTAKKQSASGPLSALVEVIPENVIVSLQHPKQMLQVIFFALFFGSCLLFIPQEKAAKLRGLFNGVNDVFLKMVEVIMKGAPFFVFALMAGVLSKMASTLEELVDMMYSLGMYTLVVIAGLVFMVVFYPFAVTVLVKRLRYVDFWKKIAPAQLTAFSTSSSAATLPVTMDCVEKGIGVKAEISSFVLPVGATVNMDGTSLYQAVAVIFLAQLHLIDLSVGEQALIVLMATLSSIGSAAVPSGGLVMLMVVLTYVGLNPLWIAIILPVDRLLDMCRTVVNVTGDASVTTVIAASEKGLLPPDVPTAQ